jgi:hypothetical protein
VFRNVVVTGATRGGKIVCGNGSHACRGIAMENVSMSGISEQAWECGGDVEGSAVDCTPPPCFGT